jgi:hypothetical protein
MTTNEIYTWLKDHSVVHTESGGTYDVVKFKEAISLIEFLMEERDYWKNAYMEATSAS